MKKITFVLAVLFAGFSQAQESSTLEEVKKIINNRPVTNLKGSWVVGGTVGFEKSEAGASEVTEFDIVPRVGYFIKDDILLGAGLGYSYIKQNGASDDTFAVTGYGRKYWMPENRFMPFAQGDVTLGFGEDETGDSSLAWGLNVRPGFTYRFSKHVSFDASVGRIGYNNNGGDDNESYGVRFNLDDVNLGILIFL